jgi:hypothetical protein
MSVQNLIHAEGVRGKFELGQNPVFRALRLSFWSSPSQIASGSPTTHPELDLRAPFATLGEVEVKVRRRGDRKTMERLPL